MRIAITGATGMVGTALSKRLTTEGHDVVPIGRGGPDDADADWDPAAGWIRPGAFDGCDAVVHLSGASIAGKRWSESYKQELRSSRIDTANLLVDHFAAMENPPSAFVCANAVGYYGNTGDTAVTEAGPQGEGFLADLCADWETAALRAQPLGIRTVVLRSGITLESILPRMLLPFKLGVGGRLGNGRQYMAWITLEDLVSVYVHALASDDLSGPINAVSPRTVTNREFTKALGSALHRPTILPLVAPQLRLMFGPGSEEMLLYGQRAVPEKLLSRGCPFAHRTIEDGIAAARARLDDSDE